MKHGVCGCSRRPASTFSRIGLPHTQTNPPTTKGDAELFLAVLAASPVVRGRCGRRAVDHGGVLAGMLHSMLDGRRGRVRRGLRIRPCHCGRGRSRRRRGADYAGTRGIRVLQLHLWTGLRQRDMDADAVKWSAASARHGRTRSRLCSISTPRITDLRAPRLASTNYGSAEKRTPEIGQQHIQGKPKPRLAREMRLHCCRLTTLS